MLKNPDAAQHILSASPRVAVAAEILKALGHPIRLRIIALLCEGDEHVTGLAERLDAPRVIVSQQLRILRTAGLVSATREKGRVFYSLAKPGLTNLIRCIEGCTDDC